MRAEVASRKIFYGWYMVAACVIMNALIGGLLYRGLSTLVNPIATTFGWGYATISLASSLRGAEMGLLNPFFGRAVDRWPAKWLVLIGVIITGAGFICLSQISNLPMLFIGFFIIAVGNSLGVSMAPMAAIARWFDRDLGKANGVMAIGTGLGGFAVPILTILTVTYGWRNSLLFVAATVFVVGIPLAFIFRTRPEDSGMFPDGKPPRKKEGLKDGAPAEPDFSVNRLLKTRAFWQLGFAQMLHWIGVSAMELHVIPYLLSVGMDRTTASLIAMLFPIVSVPTRFAFGWAADNFRKKYVSAISMALMGAGFLIFSYTSIASIWMAFLFVTVYGFGLGGVVPLGPPLVREYFGSRKFGSIWGLLLLFRTVTSVAVPPLAGWFYDTRGEYYPIWLLLGIATLLGIILMVTLPPSRRTSV